jgi:hypothetical protein
VTYLRMGSPEFTGIDGEKLRQTSMFQLRFNLLIELGI